MAICLAGPSASTNTLNPQWPIPVDNHAGVFSRQDAFDVLDIQCRVYADGVGDNVDMYGPQ